MYSRGTLPIILFFILISSSLIQSKKINEGTNYEVDEEDIITYTKLGHHCDPAVQGDNKRKQGICAATLFCNKQTKLCDCQDIGPYKYTAVDGKCKNYVGSRCFNDLNCVPNASCQDNICQCNDGESCVSYKVPAKPA